MKIEWQQVRLGEVCQVNPDKRDSAWPYAYIRYIDISSVGTGILNEPPKVIPVSDAPSRAQRLVRDGDTIVSTVRPNRRSFLYMRSPNDDTIVSTGFAVLRARDSLLDRRFLYYLIYDPTFTKYLESRAEGSAYPAVRPEVFEEAEVVLPPLPVQRRIAHILGTLDDKIELNRRMNRTLERIAQAIFKSWFIDFDPVRAKAEGRDPGLPAEIADLFPDSFEDSPLGPIPEGWGCSTIGDEFNLTMGQSPPGETYNESREGVPFFQGRRDFGFRYPTNRVYCTAPTRFAAKDDTLISVRAPVGDVNMAFERCSVGRGVAAARHKSGSRSYTYYAMQSLRSNFHVFDREGTVFGSISKTDFEAIPWIAVPPGIVNAFEHFCGPIDQRIELNELQSRRLASLRDTLLPKLLSGEIDVSTLEGLDEEVAESGQAVEKPSPEAPTETVIYTIGHSNHPVEKFIGLLKRHGITAIADVRSSPYSRHNPQFNKKPLAAALKKTGIAYVFLGEELGARPKDPACYNNGSVDFDRLAAREQFRRGIERVLKGSEKYRLALMCAEKEPLDCHRTILVCRHLAQRGVCIKHILADGSVEEHRQTEARLLKAAGLEPTLFAPGDDESRALERAYARRGEEIAYKTQQGKARHEHG